MDADPGMTIASDLRPTIPSMRVLILGINYAPEPTGIAVYTSGMARALAAAGHDVTVVSGQPYYPGWKIMPGHKATRYSSERDGDVRLIRCPLYIPAAPSGFRRILQHASFALSSLLPMLREARRQRPDVVFVVAPSLVAAPVGRLAAWLCGARAWLHIQDFEVEAAFATALIDHGGIAARMARAYERRVLGAFDRVSAISPQMCRKLREKGVPESRIVEFRNWTDVSAIRPATAPSPYREEWDVRTPHVALYSGSIANKQGIEIIIEAAHRLKDRDSLTFVICGRGPHKARLEALAGGLPNIRFHDLQPIERLNDLMNLATVHLLPQVEDAADLMLPSKLTNMLASGRPVVATAAPGTGLAAELEGCGIATAPGDAVAFAGAIESLTTGDVHHARLSAGARQRAEQHLSAAAILGRFELELASLRAGCSDVDESGLRTTSSPTRER